MRAAGGEEASCPSPMRSPGTPGSCIVIASLLLFAGAALDVVPVIARNAPDCMDSSSVMPDEMLETWASGPASDGAALNSRNLEIVSAHMWAVKPGSKPTP